MTRHLYSTLLYLLAPLQFIKLWRRGKKLPAYRQRWAERLALFPAPPKHRRIWLHAVSVGETIAAAPLAERLLQQYPDHKLLFTTTTPTGSEQVQKLFGDRVEHYYFPYDLPDVIRRFLDKTRPELLIVMETELWPNCFHHCKKRNIPIIIANARISPDAFASYRKIHWFIKNTLKNVTHIAAQSETDRQRFIELGASAKIVKNVGNLKYDIKPDQSQIDAGRKLRKAIGKNRPVWIAASTHEGEEEICIRAHKEIRKTLKDALLILVPRHPERFEAVAQLCKASKMPVKRRSKTERPNDQTAIYLGDTMGELMLLYAASDIAFVGGSFNDTGGHNPLEPAIIGLPVLSGPTIHNFDEPYQALTKAGNAKILNHRGELAPTVIELLTKKDLRKQKGENGIQVIEQSRGALDWITKFIDHHLAR